MGCANMCPRSAPLSAIVLVVLFASVAAHSNLIEPPPTRKLVCRAGNGQPNDCYGPCPALDRFGKPTGINEGNPGATWSRGSTQFVAYQRNNHAGKKTGHGPTGFMRLTLVPVDQMMSKEAHDSHAFHFSCWGEGEHNCPSRDENTCGNDKSGLRYGTHVSVPTNYPDGVYVFGYSWYGGGDYKEESFFGDYFSCSFVRIQGGPLTEGATTATSSGECWSATDRLGVCSREPCLGKGISLTRPHLVNGGSVAPRASAAFNRNSGSESQGPSSGGLEPGPVTQDSGSDVIARILMVNLATMQSTDLWPNSLGDFNQTDFPRGFNVEAVVPGGASHVEFRWEGNYKREGTSPYLLAGNVGAKYGRWRNYPVGYDFTLTVDAYVSGAKHSKSVQLRID